MPDLEPRRILGLIPARGGSQGLPRKNVLPLGGKPLIAHTIDAARSSRTVDRVIVSTDDDEIAEVARAYGAEVPFRRPGHLATAVSSSMDVLLHALSWLSEKEGYRPDFVCLLQPTSPLRTAEDIDCAIEIVRMRQAEAVVSVTKSHDHPWWLKQLTPDGRLVGLFPDDVAPERRQDKPAAYAINGALYLVAESVVTTRKTFYTDRTFAYVMPEERSLDIDSAWDLHLASLILSASV